MTEKQLKRIKLENRINRLKGRPSEPGKDNTKIINKIKRQLGKI